MIDTCETLMCDNPRGDGIVCRKCLKHLEQVLAETRWLMTELDVVLIKATRYADGGGKVTIKGNSQPMPFNAWASQVADDFKAKVLLWTNDVSRSAKQTILAAWDVNRGAAWLLSNLEAVRIHPAAGDIIDELCGAYAAALYAIDRPMERKYLGDCGADIDDVICTEPLWARDGEELVWCKVCGTEWLAPARAEQIKRQAVEGLDDRLMTATQAAETIVAYGVSSETNATRLTDRIRKWAKQPDDPAKKPRLAQRTMLGLPGQRRRPGYRFGDVVKLEVESDRKRAGKQPA